MRKYQKATILVLATALILLLLVLLIYEKRLSGLR